MATRHAISKPTRIRGRRVPHKVLRPDRSHLPAPVQALKLLSNLRQGLRLALCASTTASMALRGQAAERDEELAVVLDHCCASPLLIAIEDIEKLLQNTARQDPTSAASPADRPEG
jgi:hypothetical protein